MHHMIILNNTFYYTKFILSVIKIVDLQVYNGLCYTKGVEGEL